MHDPSRLISHRLEQAAMAFDATAAMRPRGVVRRVGDGVAMVAGLDDVGYEELLAFDSGAFGMAYDLRADITGAILLSEPDRVREGEGVVRMRRLPELPVGPATLGRVIDPLGHPLDEGPPLPRTPRLPLFRPAPQIIERKRIDSPLWTGVMAIDAAIPIGRGQRELIIGDRNVGKTALALDCVAAQHRGDVACVYVVIGQPASRVLALREAMDKAGCLNNTVIVSANASATPGMQYLAPYAGASVAEWFRDQGGHALVVYDDLTKHADAYRELALLLDRPPGREAYPGDIFFIHAELLERATARREEAGGGSVTALPLIETSDGDISSYIPTNLISITDGQIFLDTGRFERDLRPAIDIGRSVSRIGAMAQSQAMRQASRNLRIRLSRFESVEKLTRVGLELDPATQETLRRGQIMRQLLRQPRFKARDPAEQFLTLTIADAGLLDGVKPMNLRRLIPVVIERLRQDMAEIIEALNDGRIPRDDDLQALASIVAQVKEALAARTGATTPSSATTAKSTASDKPSDAKPSADKAAEP